MSISGKIIRQKRQALKWTQQDLADKMEVRVRTIQRWEDEESKVPASKEEKLIMVLEGKDDKLHDIDEFVLYLPKKDLLKLAEGAKDVRIVIRLTCILIGLILWSCTHKKKDYGSNVFICSEGSAYHINKECSQLKKCSQDVLMIDRSELLDVHPDLQRQPCAMCSE